MAYWLDKWTTPNHIEYEFKYAGNYGAKGETRQKKQKATPEQIKKQNQLNREKKILRLIRANFFLEDLWVTLKYPRGTRKPLEEVKKDFKKFQTEMRRAYKNRGQPFKYIYRIEIGKRGGIHIHVILNRLEGSDTDLVVRAAWPGKRVDWTTLREEGGFEPLANYIVKEPGEEMEGQMSLFSEDEQKQLCSYNTSRNLIRPVPERKTYKRRTLRQLIEQGAKATPGFYIVPESIRRGVNRYTGMSYYRYTECRIRQIETRAEWNAWMENGGRDG